MSSVPAGDWGFEELEGEPFEEAEPFTQEPWEASDPWGFEEAEAEFDDEAVVRDHRGQPPGRPLPPPAPLRGVQTAVVRTPAGNAAIKLPSRVPTLAELGRVQRELALTRRQLQSLSTHMRRSRHVTRRTASDGSRGAVNGIFIMALESVRDVLRDVGTLSLIRTAET